jgi:hypothetical protein
MTIEEILKLLDKKDFGIALTGGVTGFVVDAIFFATTGLPPGTVAGLSAAGSVGLKYLFNNAFTKRKLKRRANNLTVLLEQQGFFHLSERLKRIRGTWEQKIIGDDDFENRMTEIITEYLENINKSIP